MRTNEEMIIICDTILGIIVSAILRFGSSIGLTFSISWIARPRISINENATEVEINYRQLDSDQVVTMMTKELTLFIFFCSMRLEVVDFQT
jgi:hypothetical protein